MGGTGNSDTTRKSAVVFAPLPLLTVTVEARGDQSEIHLHAGGQGVWQARMINALGVPVTLCGLFGGETGRVLQRLIPDEGIALQAVEGVSRNGAYVHDRRAGQRTVFAEAPGDPLSRHELDELHNLVLVEGLDAKACLLSGPAEPGLVPSEVYHRLAHDLTDDGRHVVADLTGEDLSAVVDGGANVIKVSHEELLADGRAGSESVDDLLGAMRQLRAAGAELIVVSRAAEPALAMIYDDVYVVAMRQFEPADSRGAGDSMTAGIAAALATGEDFDVAVRLGAAAGALNVTRSGLGTGEGGAVLRLMAHIQLHRFAPGEPAEVGSPTSTSRVATPNELAERAREK
jgi:1-phosphofructokinase